MAGTSAGDITSDVITELSQVPGLATQIYASGRIIQFVQDAYQLEHIDLWWPDYMCYFNVPVDGTTGLLATDLAGPISTINSYTDIAAVWPEWNNRRLRELPPGMNPYFLSTNGMASMMMYMSPDGTVPNRPFRVWPVTSVGNVVVYARQHSTLPFNSATMIYLDRLLLTYDAAWMYCVDDGTVPSQVQKYQMLAANRRKQLRAALTQHPLELDYRFPSTLDPTGELASGGWFTLNETPLA
jgi:hypothetical protein